MLSKETESKVVNILKTVASGESSIDVTRKILSDNLEFDPYQIFTNLVKKGNEFITPYDIVDYFNTKNIFISYTEANISNYNQSIPLKNLKKCIVKDKNKSLSRKSTYTNIRNYSDSFHSNISCVSKNLLNKLDIINKEVEQYQHNYERLKKETKRRNKNVIKILSSNYFEIRNNPIFWKYNNSCNGIGKNIIFFDNKDLENEKQRNLKNELNNFIIN